VGFSGEDRFFPEEDQRDITVADRCLSFPKQCMRSRARRLKPWRVVYVDLPAEMLAKRLKWSDCIGLLPIEHPRSHLLVRGIGERPDHGNRAKVGHTQRKHGAVILEKHQALEGGLIGDVQRLA
jgi:hypothetical protein